MFRLATTFLLVLIGHLLFAQIDLSFHVRDESGEALPGATVQVNDSIILITDEGGVATVNLPKGEFRIKVSFVGYEPREQLLTIDGTRSIISLDLKSGITETEEVVITRNKMEDQLNNPSTGFREFSIRETENLPYLLGERDPVKYIQTQAGVISGTDGNNGYYVRGGGIDQNLIKVDNIELYNTNHLFGFFSMFNAQAIDRVSYFKSGLTADLGRRLSSTMKVFTRNPDLSDFNARISTGLLSANLATEVPLIEGKSGLLVAVRRSYLDLITQNLFSEDSDLRRRTDYRFYDLTVKYHQKINNRDHVSLTFLSGSDDYIYRSNSALTNTISWSTNNIGFTWKHIRNEDFDFELFVTSGIYKQQFEADISSYHIRLNSNIRDVHLGLKFYRSWDQLDLLYGYEGTLRYMKPNNVRLFIEEDQFALSQDQKIPTTESALYSDINFKIRKKLELGLGLRISQFLQLGPYTEYQSIENFQILDTVNYEANEIVTSYYNPEPRIRLKYRWSNDLSVKVSYDRNFQYVHLAPVSSISLPTDIWVPSSRRIKPQDSHQFAASLDYLIRDPQMLFTTTAFYKQMHNQLEYRSGAIVGYSIGNNFDDVFIFGNGESRGVEISAKKPTGPITGEVSYTLSKTERTFPEINQGRSFAAKYDRTHDLNVITSLDFKQWTFSSVFKYATGNALTLPVARYIIEGNIVSEYLDRNTLRMPEYHRMDLSVTYYADVEKTSSWMLSIFNVYNKRNPYFIYLDVKGDVGDTELDVNLEQVSLFPILPSLTYSRKF